MFSYSFLAKASHYYSKMLFSCPNFCTQLLLEFYWVPPCHADQMFLVFFHKEIFFSFYDEFIPLEVDTGRLMLVWYPCIFVFPIIPSIYQKSVSCLLCVFGLVWVAHFVGLLDNTFCWVETTKRCDIVKGNGESLWIFLMSTSRKLYVGKVFYHQLD